MNQKTIKAIQQYKNTIQEDMKDASWGFIGPTPLIVPGDVLYELICVAEQAEAALAEKE